MRATRESIEYSLDLLGPRRYELVVIDRKRGKQWACAGAFSEEAIQRAHVDVRATWNERVVLDLWAAIDVDSPDTLVEAHTRGWINAFQVHAHAIRSGLFAGSQRGAARLYAVLAEPADS